MHPRHVLEHDNITLMGVTPKHAFFCVAEPDVDVYDMQVQYRISLRLLELATSEECKYTQFSLHTENYCSFRLPLAHRAYY